MDLHALSVPLWIIAGVSVLEALVLIGTASTARSCIRA
jgi:hypothetical protein